MEVADDADSSSGRGESSGETALSVQQHQRRHRAVGILQYIFALILHFNEFSRGAQLGLKYESTTRQQQKVEDEQGGVVEESGKREAGRTTAGSAIILVAFFPLYYSKKVRQVVVVVVGGILAAIACYRILL